jgi:hypothetical protein
MNKKIKSIKIINKIKEWDAAKAKKWMKKKEMKE